MRAPWHLAPRSARPSGQRSRALPSPRALRIAFACCVLGLTAAVAGAVIAAHAGNGTETPVPYRDLTHAIGRLEVFGAPTRHVFRRQSSYVRYVSGRLGTAAPVDYPHEMVVLFAVGPRSTPAYRLTVAGVERRGSGIYVRVRELAPGPDDRTPSRLVSPYRAISIPWTRRPVTIEWLGR